MATKQHGSFSSIWLRPVNAEDNDTNYCFRQFCCAFTLIILLTAAIQGFFIPGIIRQKVWTGIEDGLIHTKVDWGSSSFCSWQNNTGEDDAKIYHDLYLYNVTNPEEVLQGAVPKLKMVGPFSYLKYSIKYNPQFSEDKNHVTYVEWSWYKWNPATAGKGLTPTSNITILNPIFFGLVQMPEYFGPEQGFFWHVLDQVADISDILLTGHANDLIFGIEVPLLKRIAATPLPLPISTTFKMFSNVTDPLYAEAAWGTASIYTGNDDRKRVGMQRTYNGSEDIWYYAKPFPLSPAYVDYYGIDRIKKNEDILIWVEDVYRTAEFFYNESTKLNGVEVYRYKLKMHPQLDNSSVVPSNQQFYQFGPSGMTNMSSCPPGSKDLPFPLFVGKPHNKDSGWEWTNAFLGLNEPSDFDETYIDIEPITGATFRAKKFLQFNFPYNTSWAWYNGALTMNGSTKWNVLHNRTYLHPIGAAMQHFEVSDDDCKTFVKDIYGTHFWATASFVVGIVCCILLAVVLLCMAYCVCSQQRVPRGSINDAISGRNFFNKLFKTESSVTPSIYFWRRIINRKRCRD